MTISSAPAETTTKNQGEIGIGSWWHFGWVVLSTLVACFAFAALTQGFFLRRNRAWEAAALILVTFKGTEDALTRLLMVDRVMIIPRAEGNLEHGEALYQKQCAACHGKTGKGRGMFPMLVGQYTNYLKRQVDLYLKGDRPHDEEGTVGVLNGLKEQDIQDILAYLTSIQEPTE